MIIKGVLNRSHNLPHRLLVRFAVSCAEDVRHLLKDPTAIKALDITKLWLQDKATDEEVRAAAYIAFAVGDPAYADYAAAHAAYSAAHAAASAASYAAAYAANASGYAFAAGSEVDYEARLLSMIDNLTDLEKEMWKT